MTHTHTHIFPSLQVPEVASIYIYLGLPTCAKLLLFCQKLCFLTQRRLFSPAGSFQCLHTLASIKIAKRLNLPSKRRNLPAKRRFFCLVPSWTHGERFFSERAFFSATGKIIAVLGNGVNFTCWKVQVYVCVCIYLFVRV